MFYVTVDDVSQIWQGINVQVAWWRFGVLLGALAVDM